MSAFLYFAYPAAMSGDSVWTAVDGYTGATALGLAATGGILLGPEYHFDLTRPGIGLYGGLPFAQATPVIELDLPVVQIRDVAERQEAER